jgi:hypothetical protein
MKEQVKSGLILFFLQIKIVWVGLMMFNKANGNEYLISSPNLPSSMVKSSLEMLFRAVWVIVTFYLLWPPCQKNNNGSNRYSESKNIIKMASTR